jgi:hypothetical protein
MQSRHFHLNSSQDEMQYFMILVNVRAPVWAKETGRVAECVDEL